MTLLNVFDLIESPPDADGVTLYAPAAWPAVRSDATGDALPGHPGGKLEIPPISFTKPNLNKGTDEMFDDDNKAPAPGPGGAPENNPESGELPVLRPPLPGAAPLDEPVAPPDAPPEKEGVDDSKAEKKPRNKPSSLKKEAPPVDPLLESAKAQIAELSDLGKEVLSTLNRGHRGLYEIMARGLKVFEDNTGNEKNLAAAIKAANVKPAKSGEAALNKKLLPIFQATFGVYRKAKNEVSSAERTNLGKKISDYALAVAEAAAGGVASSGLADFLAEPGNGIDKLASAQRVRLRAAGASKKRSAKKSITPPSISGMGEIGVANITNGVALGEGALVLVAFRSGDGKIEIKHAFADEALAQQVIKKKTPAAPPAPTPEA